MPKTLKRKKIIDKKEFYKLLIGINDFYGHHAERSLEFKSLIAFLWRSGVRVSEALAVKREDIRTDGKYLYVSYMPLKTHTIKPDSITLPFELYDDIEKNLVNKLIITQAKKIPAGHKVWDLSRITVWRNLSRIANLYPHNFRHTRATLLADAGAGEEQLKKWFGWSKQSKMSAIYVNRSKINMAKISSMGDD